MNTERAPQPTIGGHHAGERPAKRRRVDAPSRTTMPALADGFVVHDTPTTAKAVHRPTVPRFVSAFGQSNGVEASTRAEAKQAAYRKDKGKGKATMVHKPPVLVSGFSGGSSMSKPNDNDAGALPEKAKDKKRLGSVAHLAVNAQGTAKPAGIGTVSRLRPAPAAPAVVLPTIMALRQINPPTILLPPKASCKPLQPIQPPNLPLPSKKKELYALSTSGLGRLSDLSSQNVAESLAGILLRDQRPELALLRLQEDKEGQGDSALLRGLQMSPVKAGKGKWKGKGKGPSLIRGGLASQAASFFERSSTAHILWKKDIERTGASLPAEFSARVVKILHQPAAHALVPLSSSYAPCIALCQIRAPNGGPHPKYQARTLYRVVFATPTPTSTATNDKLAPYLAERQSVSIFTPYRELPTSPNASNTPPRRQPAPLPLLLFTPPAPTPTPDPLTAPVHNVTIICTRFQIHG